MPEGIVPQKDHRDYRDEINESLSNTSYYQSELLGILQTRQAVPLSAFMGFYKSFNHLYNLTARLKVMQEHEKELVTKIETWLEYTNKVDIPRVIDGTLLFREWSWKLEYHGIHTFTK